MSSAVALLQTMFDYSTWARNRLLDAARPLTPEQLQATQPGVYGSLHETLTHMASSQWFWMERLQGRSPEQQPTGADFADLVALRAWWDEQAAAYEAYFTGLTEADLDRTISYTHYPSGQLYTRRVGDVLLHVANHQTEHRSQVAALLTQQGVEAPATDLVVFLRPV